MYTLLNFYIGSKRSLACKPEMKSTTPQELMNEIKEFIEDGHSEYILEKLEKTEYHIDLETLTEWMKNGTEPLHVVTETSKNNYWKPLAFKLIRTTNLNNWLNT